ncbi:MAG TPA: sugar-transfer associated ATP-grasp domain-containing protein, partial [Rhizomicrobium sp.]
MRLNDILARVTGLRLVRDSQLESVGFYRQRRAMDVSNREALAILDVMAHHNHRPLSPFLKSRADDYARDILGSLDYAPWLYVYAAYQDTFREGWMPDNFYHLRVVPAVGNAISRVTGHKSFTNLVLKTESLPDLAYRIGGNFYDRDFAVIDRNALSRLSADFSHVFVKEDGGFGGSAVKKIAAKAIADHDFSGDCVVQRPIRQHPLFDDLSPQSVATLRITTARDSSGTFGMRGAFLRLGRAGRDCVVAAEAFDVIVKGADGELDALGYDGEWRANAAHPDTGATLAGLAVPHFRRAVVFCLGLHAKVPHVSVIGWDVAITSDDGIALMEWNGGHCDIKFCETMTGPHYT